MKFERIIKLDNKDIAKIIAEHFNIREYDVEIKNEKYCDEYGEINSVYAVITKIQPTR